MEQLKPKVRTDVEINSSFSAGTSDQMIGPYLKRPLMITESDEHKGRIKEMIEL